MRIRKHVCFRVDEAPLLVNYLKQNKLPFDDGEILSSFDIYENDCRWQDVADMVDKYHLLCRSETIFSKAELQSARWLRMRSQWRFGYPQPENDFGYEDITYTRVDSCPKCNCGIKQVRPFQIKHTPKWGGRHFAELNWIGDEIFVSDTVKEIFEKEHISGVSFLEVCNKNGSEKVSGVSQMVVNTVLDAGLLHDQQSIRETATCQYCGISKHVTSGIGTLSFHKRIMPDKIDIVKSGDMFGSGHYATRVILVKQNVYQLIIENKLDRALVFEPIELI